MRTAEHTKSSPQWKDFQAGNVAARGQNHERDRGEKSSGNPGKGGKLPVAGNAGLLPDREDTVAGGPPPHAQIVVRREESTRSDVRSESLTSDTLC